MSDKLFGFEKDGAWSYENGFYLTSHQKRISKMLAHYELYKEITTLPGHVVECGVYKGASLIRFATYRELLENPHSRKIIGFDAFGSFPVHDSGHDASFIERFENEGGDGISVEELEKVFAHKGFENYELVKGDILETVPSYLSAHPELKISLLHIDVDVYRPSQVILETLYNSIVSGGMIVLDDYGTVAGETKAVDEFFEGKNITIQKLPISHIPSFIIKP